MKIEDLNKTQIILLTLLVSFVTSIATGIVTVSLFEQAPPGLTQTINRVVERTVERVVTEPGKDTIVTKETTVVVKEEDTITKAIDSVSPNILPILSAVTLEDGSPSKIFVSWGLVVSGDGMVVTDSLLISDSGFYSVEVSGEEISLEIISQNEEVGIAVLKMKPEKGKVIPKFVSPKLADSQGLRLGQSVIAFGGKSKKSVSTGIISSLYEIEVGTSTSTPKNVRVYGIESTALAIGGVTGGPLLNVFGDIIGLSVSSDFSRGGLFRASNFIKEELEKVEKSAQSAQKPQASGS